MRGVFILGTDTGVGKSVLSAALLAAMAAAGERVVAFKPVVTGLEDYREPRPGGWPADHELLALAAGMDAAEVSPYLFQVAASPHLAAEIAGVAIDPDQVRTHARAACADDSILVAEGVGGLLVPLTGDWTICDLAVELGLPVVIAARPGLGTINHTLLTLSVARASGLDVRAVVLTPWRDHPTTIEVSNRDAIARLGGVEVAVLAPVDSPTVEQLRAAGAALPWAGWVG